MTPRETDILVVGAGPAGIAAATAAARRGRQVCVLDDNACPGGQIWRSGVMPVRSSPSSAKLRAIAAFQASGAVMLPGRRVFNAPQPGVLQALVDDRRDARVEAFQYKKLILATGARERFLPFPGWTLPGVFGAGGLQALVQGGVDVAGRRIVVAGTGPLLLAVAAHLKQYGAKIVCVAEQAPLRQMLPFALSVWAHPGKLLQGARYRAALRGTPFRTGCWPVECLGDGRLVSVRLTDGRRTWNEACDMLACGFHLVPNTELAALLGCAMNGDFVRVDSRQQTSLADVFCAGEPTGIAGVDAALVQGEVAGLCAAEAGARHKSSARLQQHQAFAQRLDKAFRLRNELLSLARPETIVCRCEDVPYAQLKQRHGWTDAKLQTRCGMGPCQGRICAPAVQALFGWRASSVRPPLFPVPVSALCGIATPSIVQHTEHNLQEIV